MNFGGLILIAQKRQLLQKTNVVNNFEFAQIMYIFVKTILI